MQTQVRKDPIIMDEICDSASDRGELSGIHPQLIMSHQKALLEAKLFNASSLEPFHPDLFYKYAKLAGDDWYGKDADRLRFRVQSPIMHWLSTFEAYKDWCSQQHPEMDSTKCASVYQLVKTKDEFDTFQGRPYVSYIDGKITFRKT